VQLVQQRHDPLARARVEVARRLVREDDRRPPEQRAGDRDALALAAGELRRHVPRAMAEAHAVERRRRLRPPLRRTPPRVQQPSGDVVERGHPVEQEELLEDEADPMGADGRELRLPHRRHVVPGDAHDAARGALERAHDVQQRGLARAGRPDHRRELPRGDRQRDAVEDVDRPGIGLPHAVELEHGGHRAVTTVSPSRSAPSTSTRSSA
jgi:hypothetical protein